MKRLNFSCLIPESQYSKLLTAFFEPKDSRYQFEAMHDYLYERGITIYPGKLIEVNTFRIANIGDLYPEDIRTFIKNLETYLIESKLIVRPDCN
jgi:2-aminoethylphosphonate-pyruvate transaminase